MVSAKMGFLEGFKKHLSNVNNVLYHNNSVLLPKVNLTPTD